MFSVAIIEDDPSIVLDYEMTLKELGIQNITNYNSIESALEKLKNNIPDLLFLDVKLKGEDGFKLFEQLDLSSTSILVLTGFEDPSVLKLVEEKKVSSLMIKPINTLALKYELIKIFEKKNAEQNASFTYLDFKSKLQKLKFSHIIYLETEGNYTTIHCVDSKHVVKKSLTTISKSLPANQFQRIFRNIMVNINEIESVDFSKSKVHLSNSTVFSLGAKYKSEIKNILSNNYKILK